MRTAAKLSICFLLFAALTANGQTDSIPQKTHLIKKIQHTVYRFVKGFSDVDTNYIEPQHYNFAVMLQNTNTYERYQLSTQQGQSIVLAPEPSIKLGPYFGWRWLFLGYTLDIRHLSNNQRKKEFDISLYSSQLGIDLFWRENGNYKIRSLFLGSDINTQPIEGSRFGGFRSSIKGLNLYYIFNHKRFSYPAAFSQSTVQRRSCGSALIGIGYTKHNTEIDATALNQLIAERIGTPPTPPFAADADIIGGSYRHTDLSLAGGYAYNWVFARDWLFASSLSLGLGYKQNTGDVQHKQHIIRDFNFSNFNIDAIGRFGIVWNNTRYFAGASAIFHTYNYRKDQISTNSLFGSLNIYFGFNFNKR